MEKLKETKDRLQFLGVLVFFFPTVLEGFFRFSSYSEKEISKIGLQWGLLIFLFLFNYLFFEICGSKIHKYKRALEYINCSLLCGVCFFSFIILMIAFLTSDNNPVNNWAWLFLYTFSLYGLVAVPIINILVILGSMFRKSLSEQQ